MNYLFIDGSEINSYVQAGNDSGFIFQEFKTHRNLAAKITEISDETILKAGFSKTQVDSYVVCTGPGSLTGLRVAGSFLRTSAFINNKPLIGIDLFSWSAATIKASGRTGRIRLVTPTLIDKAFVLEVDLDNDLDLFTPNPSLEDSREPTTDMPNYGMRWQAEGIELVVPEPKILHQMILKQNLESKNEFAEILKVLPMYIIPSQAERKLQEKEC